MKPRFALYLGFALCLLIWGAALYAEHPGAIPAAGQHQGDPLWASVDEDRATDTAPPSAAAPAAAKAEGRTAEREAETTRDLARPATEAPLGNLAAEASLSNASGGLAPPTPGQVWRCEDSKGCVAYDTNVDGGPPKKIIFRQGDIVYEATGLTLSTDDGRGRVRRKGGDR